MAQFMTDINRLWTSSERACPCNSDAYSYGGCANNAFVTSASPGYAFYDTNFINSVIAADGNRPIGGAIVMAHETGHNIQLQFGGEYQIPVNRELAADCFAGYFLGMVECDGQANMQDSMAAFSQSCANGDPAGEPWYAPGAHGSCQQRETAIQTGYAGYQAKQPPLNACALP